MRADWNLRNAAQGSNVMNLNEANSRENKSSTTVYVDLNTSISLQTANTSVTQIHQPRSAVTMRILFDSGIQRSYISERAKKSWVCSRREKRSYSSKRLEKKTKT